MKGLRVDRGLLCDWFVAGMEQCRYVQADDDHVGGMRCCTSGECWFVKCERGLTYDEVIAHLQLLCLLKATFKFLGVPVCLSFVAYT